MLKAQDEIPLVRAGGQHSLPPLKSGMQVPVQDALSKVWDRTGIVKEACLQRQYLVKVAGSERISMCNRYHLQQTQPLTPANLLPGSSQDRSGDAAEPQGDNRITNSPRTPRPYQEHRQPVCWQDYEM
ncbi:hypothetical protein E2C01_037158 [Portunus trituberculatus]|uniref:Uncharacterized protein n=1 Tax=Portunus trituberculatus TaxID=210409 RepID=A0A5B7FE77_PORTR|nr:hypothetical protein [Portunus trituberculatus]